MTGQGVAVAYHPHLVVGEITVELLCEIAEAAFAAAGKPALVVEGIGKGLGLGGLHPGLFAPAAVVLGNSGIFVVRQ